MWDPGICDFVEATTNTFMNFISYLQYKYTVAEKSALAINKNASANYDVTSRFDVVGKNLSKS